MSYEGAGKRRRERQALQLPLQVECRESLDHEWTGSAQLLDVTPFGARIQISCPTEPGRLLHLALPLPRQLRCFDHEREKYFVWALVRHVRVVDTEQDRAPEFEIGVAFVGKEPPLSFAADPARRYQIGPPDSEDSLWSVQERDEAEVREAGRQPRAEQRYNIEDEVIIEVYDASGRVHAREQARTENISRRGMAVLTSLNIVRGRYVRVRSTRYKMAVIAAVRRLRRSVDGSKHLHLEFVDQQWPSLEEPS